MYDEMNSSLDSFLKLLSPNDGVPPVFAAELATANGNIGENLLRPEVMSLLRLELDALKSMGIKGVVVGIKFPLLEPDFPRSDEYLQFYRQVAAEVRQRRMKILVEVGPVFAGTIYSSLTFDWSKHTKQSFIAAQKNELQLIAREIHPDILQISNEPTTIEMLTGYKFTPSEYADFIEESIRALNNPKDVRLGAGAGTWEDPAYLEKLLAIQGLDCIDLHIYPIGRNGNLLKQAQKVARQAHAAGKCVNISESGLYKISSNEMKTMMGQWENVYRRDVYSFFEPLDEKFIQVLTLFSRAEGVEFVSYFWTRNFFAYLDYDSVRNLSNQLVNRMINQAFLNALQKGTRSPLGGFYKKWISSQNNSTK